MVWEEGGHNVAIKQRVVRLSQTEAQSMRMACRESRSVSVSSLVMMGGHSCGTVGAAHRAHD